MFVCVCVCQFSKKTNCFNFFSPNVGIRISIVEIQCVPILNFDFFRREFVQKWILASEFQKCKSAFGISTSKISCVPILSQNGILNFSA